MVRSVLVLGDGRAGFLAALTLKSRLPHLPVVLLRFQERDLAGALMGEATSPTVGFHLHHYCGFGLAEFYRSVQPLWKIGTRLDWGPRPFFNHVFGFELDTKYNFLPGGTAYFLDNREAFSGSWGAAGVQSQLMSERRVWLRSAGASPEADTLEAVSPRIIADEFGYQLEGDKLVRYFETKARELNVTLVDDPLAQVLHDESGVTGLRLRSGSVLAADLYIDATGSESLLLGKTLREPFQSYEDALFCDRSLVSTWQRGQEPLAPYTTAATMDAGWCWRIEHENHLTAAYFYSSRFTRDEAALTEFQTHEPNVAGTLRVPSRTARMVSFQPGRYARAWVKNVVAIGAAAAVIEPLQDTALAAICLQCQALAESLVAGVEPAGVEPAGAEPVGIRHQSRDAKRQTAPGDLSLASSGASSRVTFASPRGNVTGTLRGPSLAPLAESIAAFNDDTARGYDAIRDFLAVHYRFNSRLDTPFWRECRSQVRLHGAADVVDHFRRWGPSPRWRCACAADKGWGEFGTEGYLALLVGQCVPYQATYKPSEQDRRLWAIVQSAIRHKVASALTVCEALALVRSDSWRWPEGLYDRSRTLRP